MAAGLCTALSFTIAFFPFILLSSGTGVCELVYIL